MMSRKIVTQGPAMLLLAAISTAGQAQDQSREAGSDADYLQKLRACLQITADDQRLACYDSSVGEVVAASDQGEVRIIDNEDVRKTRRRLFGFTLPDLNIFGGGDGSDDQLETLTSTITSVSVSGRDTFYFSIADGDAVWRIRDAPHRVLRTKVGAEVEFSRAALGSYFIRINGQTGVKGTRVQ